MSSDKPFRKIEELVAALADAQRGAGSGSLTREQLDAACDDARELYERLVVLRHKARETTAGNSPVPPVKEAVVKPVGSRSEEPRSEPTPVTAEQKPLRLDTRPVEVSPRQTSLIEAIESTELELPLKVEGPPAQTPPGKKERAPGAKTPTLAERHEHSAVTDLGKAISLSHKFWFVAELFNGDRITYEKSIEKLNSFADHSEARAFVQAEVIAKLKKPADPEALSTFTDLVQRRYA
ncbi:MAG: hypothetical protein JNL43_04020 [Flavobacteriales bacterium]|nr:hypothetical protein [Flavobacteriales bacterium]